MRRVLFIMTHLGSGWGKLVARLKEDRRFDFFQTGHRYSHVEDLAVLTAHPHRRENGAAVWSDVILFNDRFTSRELCQCCRFIYWHQPLDLSDPELANIACPMEYLEHRLAGMRQYFRRTPRAIWNPDLEDDSVFDSILG